MAKIKFLKSNKFSDYIADKISSDQKNEFKIYIYIFSLSILLFVLVAVFSPFKNQLFNLLYPKPSSHAATINQSETESGILAGPATLARDSNSSGGQYVLLNNLTSSNFQPSAPYYATFFYPWYKTPTIDGAWSDWSDANAVGGTHSPPTNWFSNYLPDVNSASFSPSTELYSSNDYNVFKWQLSNLAYAKQEVGISSWWGQGHKTDITFKNMVTDFMKRSDNPYPNFRWGMYYECEGNVCNGTMNPTVSQLVSDLNYILANYVSEPSMLKINGKPVMFVYADPTDVGSSNTNCDDPTDTSMTHRWYQANHQVNFAFYVVLKVFPGFATTPCQPSSWHQYAPAVPSDSQGTYSYMIAPGFWKDGNAVALQRNSATFDTNAKNMVSSNATWKLTETWNEWGEGTSVEPGDEVIQTTGSGITTINNNPTQGAFKTTYIDILNKYLPALPQGTGQGSVTSTIAPSSTPTGSVNPVIVAAGDMACGTGSTGASCQQVGTSNLFAAINPTAVLPLGDNQYEQGALSDFQSFYDPSWGRYKSITHPTVGNHEYLTANAQGYFDYFNGVDNQIGAAGNRSQGYYSYDIGNWHLISLNTNCSSAGGCNNGSPQDVWLRADLAAHTNTCTLAYFHHPMFSSGQQPHNSGVDPLFQDLYNGNADLVLVGHDHNYERFKLQDPAGNVDTVKGIKEFVIGTGGRNFTGLSSLLPNSEVFNSNTFGILKLTLHPTSYDWQFIPSVGVSGFTNGTFTDSGTQACH